MYKKTLLVIIALLLLSAPAAALAEGQSVSSSELIDQAKDYDGKTVIYEGEVIGDILYRGEFAWLAVFDGSNTIGCYVSAEQAQQISVVGGYGKRWDTVRVEGVFHRACAEHGGDLDIHAETVTVLAAGNIVEMPVSRTVLILACILPLPAAALLFLVWKRRSPQRQGMRNTLSIPAKK